MIDLIEDRKRGMRSKIHEGIKIQTDMNARENVKNSLIIFSS